MSWIRRSDPTRLTMIFMSLFWQSTIDYWSRVPWLSDDFSCSCGLKNWLQFKGLEDKYLKARNTKDGVGWREGNRNTSCISQKPFYWLYIFNFMIMDNLHTKIHVSPDCCPLNISNTGTSSKTWKYVQRNNTDFWENCVAKSRDHWSREQLFFLESGKGLSLWQLFLSDSVPQLELSPCHVEVRARAEQHNHLLAK